MLSRVTVAVGALSAVVAMTPSLGAQQSQALLARVVAAYDAAETVSVRFDQTVTNPLTDHTLSSRGEMIRKRPNLLSITFSNPASDRIVSDGTSLWVYLPSSAPGQVLRMPASGQSGMLLDPLGQILSSPLDSYTVADAGISTIDGHTTHAVTLTPKSQHALFTKATLWIDAANDSIRQIEADEPSGLTRRITVTQFKTNLTVPPSTFQFTPPANVRIVDAAGRSSY